MEGQSTIEFLGGMIMFLIVLVASLTIISAEVPQFTESLEESSHNLEMHRISNHLISSSGMHTYAGGGTEWEQNTSTISEASKFGIANSYRILDYDKLENLSTTGSEKLNYSQFREITNVKNQYYLNFTFFPVVETSATFNSTEPPSNPSIVEPDSVSPTYSSADDKVHYGSLKLFGAQYNFLVVSYDNVYNTTFISESDYDFENSPPKSQGDYVNLGGEDYKISQIQNRERIPGSSVVLSTNLNSFGPNPLNTGSSVNKLNRYAVLNASDTDKQIVRIEVLSW